MATNKQLPPGQDAPQQLFGLATYRVPGGYLAQARIATRNGYVMFGASAKRSDFVSGAIDDPPKAAAVKEALDQAHEFIESKQGKHLVPSQAKYAVATMRATRELVERAQDGDKEARVGLSLLARSPHRMLRKAVHAQRLFEE